MTDSESTRTEYLRSQMSVMERVEWLEQRSASHDGTIVDHDIRIGDLARRVAELEKGRPQFACVSGFTPGSEGERHEYVSCADLSRLRRIEEAAREAVMQWCQLPGIPGWQGFHNLRAALDSEPKR